VLPAPVGALVLAALPPGPARGRRLSEMVDAERDAWIHMAAQRPERMPFYMEMKTQLHDPGVRELYRDLTEVTRWEAEDPRLDGVQIASSPSSRPYPRIPPAECAPITFIGDSLRGGD
jgi:hypothetical protein